MIKFSTTSDNFRNLAQAVKELGFDQVISQGGTDYPDNNEFRVEYHIICVSIKKFRSIIFSLMTTIPKDKPEIETLIDIWPSAEFHEQETFENFGIDRLKNVGLVTILSPKWASRPIMSLWFLGHNSANFCPF